MLLCAGIHAGIHRSAHDKVDATGRPGGCLCLLLVIALCDEPDQWLEPSKLSYLRLVWCLLPKKL